jgi:DNA-binding PadR family transcriptional regulator
MTKWLQSGTRRDVCILLYGAGEVRLKELEARLEDHYGERRDPDRFRRKVEKLVDAGHLEKDVDGLHDVYALTAAGERALEDHVAWLREETGL